MTVAEGKTLESLNISPQLGFKHCWAPLGATFHSAVVSFREPLLFSSPVSAPMNQRVPVSLGCSLLVHEAGLAKSFLIPSLISRARHSASQGIISAHSPWRDSWITYETGPSGSLTVIIITPVCSFHQLHYDTTITTFIGDCFIFFRKWRAALLCSSSPPSFSNFFLCKLNNKYQNLEERIRHWNASKPFNRFVLLVSMHNLPEPITHLLLNRRRCFTSTHYISELFKDWWYSLSPA